MNYEELASQLNTAEKTLNESLKDGTKTCKTILKDTENGDLKDLDKAIKAMEASIESQKEALKTIREAIEGFDRTKYIVGGDFSKQMLEECEKREIDVRDLGGMVYDMFPSKVTINRETLDITLDKKKVQCFRPKALVQTVKETQEKLKKEKFNDERFIRELAAAYDLVVLKKGKKLKDGNALIKDIYAMMAPTARAKKEYDLQTFAFDLARLLASGTRYLKDGRFLDIDSSRHGSDAIRYLDVNGNENYFSMICFR
ncbi:MAG: hypothetical protein IKR11_10310 [Solobacterium sp.]|nr:hypothetical protein [Solobacterium sp.]